ncbi:adenylyl-sulfate kinase [Bradyrhizobium sp.]|uniref:adenylyl-sulfate kinase n=1 Tax=Bradyrhizobium sp. TaxID=376 RepID=UPI003C581DCF
MLQKPSAPPLALDRENELKVVVVGHVDHGKSSTIGRLLFETGALPPQKVAEIRSASDRRGVPMEWSFLLDSLQAERDQAVTIDTTDVRFHTCRRGYVIIDAPGHREFLRNMITGAARSNAALLIVDATEGMRNQSRLHAYLLNLIGVEQIVVAVNKMDLIGYSESSFARLCAEIRDYFTTLGLHPAEIIPISAREGDNLCISSARMKWYDGPTVIEAFDAFHAVEPAAALPLRAPVQDVYHFDGRRIIVGRVESGILRPGDSILFSPSNERAAVATIESWPVRQSVAEVHTGQVFGLTLQDEVFVQRGDMISHRDGAPAITDVFRGKIFWLGRSGAAIGAEYKLKLGTVDVPVRLQSIEQIVHTSNLEEDEGGVVQRNQVAEVVLRTKHKVTLDNFSRIAATGRFVLTQGAEIVGGGIASMKGFPDQRPTLVGAPVDIFGVGHSVTAEARDKRNGHSGAVIWFTGLSGAGKSTLAMAVEQLLFQRGMQTYVLDGDNVRHGLNADLRFTPQDRVENIRRVGEVANLFADAGLIVIVALISPYRSDRRRVRERLGSSFHEVYIQADLATCERRDPKGLYRRARAGEIAEFTGVSAPYEAPEEPDLIVNTTASGVEACARQIVDYVRSLQVARKGPVQ